MSQSILPALALSVTLLSGSACYNYVPTEMSAVPPGEDVRLRVSRQGGEELARIIESDEIRLEVSGRYEGLEESSVLLRVPVVRDPTGVRPAIDQVVRLPATEVLTVDRRELSVGKTAAVVGAAAGVVGLLLTEVFDVFGEGPSGDPDAELSLLPLLQLLTGGR